VRSAVPPHDRAAAAPVAGAAVIAAGVTGVVLAGGRASRFGGAPKGLARVAGVRIVDRVAAGLRATCDDLLLVANAPGAAAWLPGARVAADVWPGCGSLGGLHAALAHAGRAVLVVAWDMPFVPAALLAAMRDAGAAGAPAVVPDGEGGAEPLCAYYAADCLAAAERLLRAGERRARALGDAVGAVRLPAREVARFGAPRTIFHGVNTAAELAAAEVLAAGASPPAP
jgi:molybdopterin-guanine dinucleotide biosynthesis protein A